MDGPALHPSTCLVLPGLCTVVQRIVIRAVNMAALEVPTTGPPPEALMENYLGLLLISMDEKMHREGAMLSVIRYHPCVRQSCQPHSLRMAEEVLYVLAMVNGTLHISHPCLLCSFKPAEAQMAHRDQEQEVNLQAQAGARSYARLRLLQAGRQAVEPPLIGF